MVEYIDIPSVQPAPYNPRRIDDVDFRKLCDSVERLGIIVPIIVNRRNGIIIAGHQRHKAASAVGIDTIPCFFADNVSLSDEVLFNQIHNGTDFDQGLSTRIVPQKSTGFIEVQPHDNFAECEYKPIVSEVCKLITRYGNVLSCVADQDGTVFKAAAYATACRVLNVPANCYVVDRENEEFAKRAFSASYGVFSYGHLKRTTWVQGLAQRYRRAEGCVEGGKSKRAYKSRLYERMVIPSITKEHRVIDFGCGKGQYADMLNADGYGVDKVEFYHNDGKRIIVSETKSDIRKLIASINNRGLYDAVVLDSVLNSVDSLEAERAVMGACSALLKQGGRLFVSGRRADVPGKMMRLKRCGIIKETLEFLDADGFTARFRNGCFYYQKFHTDDQIRQLAADHGFSILDFEKDSVAWRCSMVKERESDSASFGIEYEFSLPYPGGRYDSAEDVRDAIALAKEADHGEK